MACNSSRIEICRTSFKQAFPDAIAELIILELVPTAIHSHSGDKPMKSLGVLSGWLAAAAIVFGFMTAAHAAEPTPPRSTLTQPRTGTTNKFGSGTLTNRTDGSSSRTQPFGSGSITTERTKDGRAITGHTQKFGSGTITRWSDGTTTETRPFGSGTITTERSRDGKTVTGQTQKFGSGTITNRSDGSTSRSQPFGSGTLRTDQPGRNSR
jgi:hypothetical protein